MNYHDELMSALDGWSKNPIEDEWLFENFRKRIVEKMSTVEAFQSIGITIEVLLKQSDESNAIEVLHTLIRLARQSDTTEIPLKMTGHKAAIIKQFEGLGDYANNQLKELFRFYHL